MHRIVERTLVGEITGCGLDREAAKCGWVGRCSHEDANGVTPRYEISR
jgi:hypothetical protein